MTQTSCIYWQVNGIDVTIEYRIYPADWDFGRSVEIIQFLTSDGEPMHETVLGDFDIYNLTNEIASEVFNVY